MLNDNFGFNTRKLFRTVLSLVYVKVCVCMCEWRRPAQAADFAWYDKRIFTLLFKQYIIDYNIVLYFRYALLLKRSPWRVAKKFLSTSYRKTQRDWFGKKGLPWHITVVITKDENKEIEEPFI